MPFCLPPVGLRACSALNRWMLNPWWVFLRALRWGWVGGLLVLVLSGAHLRAAETLPQLISKSVSLLVPSVRVPASHSPPASTTRLASASPAAFQAAFSAPEQGSPLPSAASEGVSAAPVSPEPVSPEPVSPEPVSPEPVSPEPVLPEPVSPEVIALTRLAEEARLEGSYARAVQLLDEASQRELDPLARWKLRYQTAMMKANVPGASLDAAHALEQLLISPPSGVPARLLEVAHAEVLRLQGFAAHGEVYQAVLRLREALLKLPMAQRLSWLLAQEQSRPDPLLERARLQLLMETYWERGEWRDVRRTLERIAELEGAWKPALLELHARARQEIRRQRLAWASTMWLFVAIFALPFSLRGLPERQRLFRQVCFALIQWGLMLMLLYLYYVLGRQRGDVSPVTLPKLAVLFVLTGGAQALGLAWRRVLEEHLTSREVRWLGVVLAVLFPVAGLYLFAYHFDYASVLNL